jgi:hypothetical protein
MWNTWMEMFKNNNCVIVNKINTKFGLVSCWHLFKNTNIKHKQFEN